MVSSRIIITVPDNNANIVQNLNIDNVDNKNDLINQHFFVKLGNKITLFVEENFNFIENVAIPKKQNCKPIIPSN